MYRTYTHKRMEVFFLKKKTTTRVLKMKYTQAFFTVKQCHNSGIQEKYIYQISSLNLHLSNLLTPTPPDNI